MESIDTPPSDEHVWSQSSEPGTAIVTAVAEVTGREPTDLPPLQRHVDTDALDSLLTRAADDGVSPVRVSFSYAGVAVTVDSAGFLDVRPDAGLPSE